MRFTTAMCGSTLAVALASCGAPAAPSASSAPSAPSAPSASPVPAARPAADARTAPAAERDSTLAATATADALHAVQAGAVRAELESYYADFSARNWPAFAGHFWPDATIATRWQPQGDSEPRVTVTSVAEFVAQAPAGPGSKPIFEERMTGAETNIEGDLAQVWSHYEARFGDPDAVKEWKGVDAFTLVRHGGAWKIVALAFTNEE